MFYLMADRYIDCKFIIQHTRTQQSTHVRAYNSNDAHGNFIVIIVNIFKDSSPLESCFYSNTRSIVGFGTRNKHEQRVWYGRYDT